MADPILNLAQRLDPNCSSDCDVRAAGAILEVLVPALEQISDGDTWKLGADAKDNIMRHGFASVDEARKALTQARAIAEGKA